MVNIPKLSDLYNSILADLQAELGVTIPLWTKAFIKILAMVQATKIHLAYLALGDVQRNIFPDTADPEATGGTLERFGRVKIGRMPLTATQGKYIVQVTGEIGATIPVSSTMITDDDSSSPGVIFTNDIAFIFSSATGEIEIRSLTAGTGARIKPGDSLTLTSPVSGVESTLIVISESVTPNDGESIEEYRSVVLESFRLMPAGGASSDYRIWAQDATGVKQSYPFAKSGAPNEVNVFIESTIENSIDGMGTPSSTTLAEAASVIEADPVTGDGRRPLGVFAVNVEPVAINKVTINIPNFLELNPEKEQLIENAIKEMIDSIRPFVAGADILENQNDVLSVNKIIAAIIEAVPGAAFEQPELIIQIGSDTPEIVNFKTFEDGNIPFVVGINYV